MFHEFRPAWAEINLDNFEYNLKSIKKCIGERVEYIGVIKGNAYGHGSIEIAKASQENGVHWFAVSMLEEGIELRKAGIDCNIMVFGYTPPKLQHLIIDYQLSQCCATFDMIANLSNIAEEMGKAAHIQIKVETGLNRSGFMPTIENANLLSTIRDLPGIKVDGIYSHFATAFEANKEYAYLQYNRFLSFLSLLEDRHVDVGMRHIANSAAIVEMPDVYLDGVRPGAMQFGTYMASDPDKIAIDLKPVMSIKANIVYIKEIEPGETVSYGRIFTAKRRSVIATIPIGFGDGYVRRLQNKACMLVNDMPCPVVGKICMDQTMIDVTDAGTVNIGDEVVVMGASAHNKIDANQLAGFLETGPGEVFGIFGRRLPRVFMRNGTTVKVDNYILNDDYASLVCADNMFRR